MRAQEVCDYPCEEVPAKGEKHLKDLGTFIDKLVWLEATGAAGMSIGKLPVSHDLGGGVKRKLGSGVRSRDRER